MTSLHKLGKYCDTVVSHHKDLNHVLLNCSLEPPLLHHYLTCTAGTSSFSSNGKTKQRLSQFMVVYCVLIYVFMFYSLKGCPNVPSACHMLLHVFCYWCYWNFSVFLTHPLLPSHLLSFSFLIVCLTCGKKEMP